MRICLYTLLAALILLLNACGTTHVFAGNNADIYANQEFIGKGEAKIRRAGFPKRTTIVAKLNGREIDRKVIKRKFDVVTLLVGFYSYGTGWLFYTRYPAVVSLATEPIDKVDPWARPSSTW